jgi:hypothetical protein
MIKFRFEKIIYLVNVSYIKNFLNFKVKPLIVYFLGTTLLIFRQSNLYYCSSSKTTLNFSKTNLKS